MSCETTYKLQYILYSLKYVVVFTTVKRERERFISVCMCTEEVFVCSVIYMPEVQYIWSCFI